jgi:competence protein ComFC
MFPLIGYNKPAYRIYQYLWIGLDWLYPPRCAGCDTPGSRWCQRCENRTQVISYSVCTICGREVSEPGLCVHCAKRPLNFTYLRSWANFEGPVRSAIHRLKYRNDISLGETFSRPLIRLIDYFKINFDLVVPVPLAKKRLQERGYNQASLLAYPISLAFDSKFSSQALIKIKETSTQVGLSLNQRLENVRNAFEAKVFLVENKKVLLVDDVCTSGATLDECAKTLKQVGASEVSALTLARANFEMEKSN